MNGAYDRTIVTRAYSIIITIRVIKYEYWNLEKKKKKRNRMQQ